MRLSGADPVLGVEMLSTGEVACLGENFSDAFSKALQSAEFNIPDRDGSVFISVGGRYERKRRVVPIAKAFVELGFKIYATEHTADVLNESGVTAAMLFKVKEAGANPNIMDYLQERKIDLVINVPMANQADQLLDILTDGYIIRRQAVEFNVPVITNLQLAAALVDVMKHRRTRTAPDSQPKRVHETIALKMWSLCYFLVFSKFFCLCFGLVFWFGPWIGCRLSL